MEEAQADPDLIPVAAVGDLPPGKMIAASLEGRPIVLANLGDEIVAFQNSCLHAGVRLSEGKLEGDVVTCRWHQWQFCARTGEVLTDESPYATFVTFPVRVSDDGNALVARTPRTKVTARPDEPEPN